jgi:hypothetical protein
MDSFRLWYFNTPLFLQGHADIAHSIVPGMLLCPLFFFFAS